MTRANHIRLENKTNGHYKFWSLKARGRSVTVKYGRIGSRNPQQKRIYFDTADEQREFVDRKIESKLSRGYKVVWNN